MQDLIRQEQFELEVLERLNSRKLLEHLVFGGGTMLRLCFGLSRFSVDLDFWILKGAGSAKLFREIKQYFGRFYELRDCTNKFYTLLFEVGSRDYPRALKIEIRKKPGKINFEQAIAYSKHSNVQVFLKVVSLEDMLRSKIEAFLERKEIRDIFDIEFLLKKGIELKAPLAQLKRIIPAIDALKQKDYKVKLASLLEVQERQYYLTQNFKIVKLAIQDIVKKEV
jgi:predicted nucleotidyltransferase component of viral defense system